MSERLKVYKGTNKDMQCNGYPFVLGEEHTEKTAELCHRGFHACENPLDVLKYYSPSDESRYFSAELDASDEKQEGDTKRVGTKIKLVTEIGLHELIKAGLQFVFKKVEKIDFKKANAANSGEWGTAANSGDGGTAANSGDGGTAANSGEWGTAANSGEWGTAANSGYSGTAETTGQDSVAVASGFKGKAKGAKGCVLFILERDDNGKILFHKSIKVDGKRYKENTFYTLSGGKVVKADG